MFAVDNALVVAVTLLPPAGRRYLGDVRAAFAVADPNSASGETVSVAFEYTLDDSSAPDAVWYPASPHPDSDRLAGLTHADVGPFTFVWDALVDAERGAVLTASTVETSSDGSSSARIPLYVPAVSLRATPTDSSGLSGDAYVSEPFALGNRPPETVVAALEPACDGDVSIEVRLTDDAGDDARIEVRFQTEPSWPWRLAAWDLGSVTDLATRPAAAGGRCTCLSGAPTPPPT